MPVSGGSSSGAAGQVLGYAGQVRTGAPLYGQHTREILLEHDFGEAEIDALLAEGAIAVVGPS